MRWSSIHLFLNVAIDPREKSEVVAQRCSVKRVNLKIQWHSQENTCEFPLNFANFLRKTPFLQNTSGGCYWMMRFSAASPRHPKQQKTDVYLKRNPKKNLWEIIFHLKNVFSITPRSCNLLFYFSYYRIHPCKNTMGMYLCCWDMIFNFVSCPFLVSKI